MGIPEGVGLGRSLVEVWCNVDAKWLGLFSVTHPSIAAHAFREGAELWRVAFFALLGVVTLVVFIRANTTWKRDP